jgi:hypothetical protein
MAAPLGRGLAPAHAGWPLPKMAGFPFCGLAAYPLAVIYPFGWLTFPRWPLLLRFGLPLWMAGLLPMLALFAVGWPSAPAGWLLYQCPVHVPMAGLLLRRVAPLHRWWAFIPATAYTSQKSPLFQAKSLFYFGPSPTQFLTIHNLINTLQGNHSLYLD